MPVKPPEVVTWHKIYFYHTFEVWPHQLNKQKRHLKSMPCLRPMSTPICQSNFRDVVVVLFPEGNAHFFKRVFPDFRKD